MSTVTTINLPVTVRSVRAGVLATERTTVAPTRTTFGGWGPKL